jgi:hypothetical protein
MECITGVDEPEWYEFTYKDKYSGEVYLELTFYSNVSSDGLNRGPG